MRSAMGLLIFLVAAVPARAASIDEALGLYKSKDYEEAAFAFYDVLVNDANRDFRDQAEIYLGESLLKLDLLVPALFYYMDLFKAGKSNRYYLNAVEGLLKVQAALHDPIMVPALLSEGYDPEGYGKLDPDLRVQINYLIAEADFRGKKNLEAREFLKTQGVPDSSPLRSKALYLNGLLDVRAGDLATAQKNFQAILDRIDEGESDPELARVRQLALISAGRTAYGRGEFDRAIEYYSSVPRFSDQWFTAMYENAWAYFRKEEYGKALGELQSVTSPYFAGRFVPEAHVIRATTYFVNCQWDRVRRAVSQYKKAYEPMLPTLSSYLNGAKDPSAVYRDVVAEGNGRFAAEIAREVRRARRFKDYHFMLQHMTWERDQIAGVEQWRRNHLAADLGMILDQQRDLTERVVGTWATRRLVELRAQLQVFQNQINIIDFEVADAETKWLEQGKEILKGRRARLPRPDIPNDQWQHWSFDREYWKDELGYVRHSLRTECF